MYCFWALFLLSGVSARVTSVTDCACQTDAFSFTYTSDTTGYYIVGISEGNADVPPTPTLCLEFLRTYVHTWGPNVRSWSRFFLANSDATEDYLNPVRWYGGHAFLVTASTPRAMQLPVIIQTLTADTVYDICVYPGGDALSPFGVQFESNDDIVACSCTAITGHLTPPPSTTPANIVQPVGSVTACAGDVNQNTITLSVNSDTPGYYMAFASQIINGNTVSTLIPFYLEASNHAAPDIPYCEWNGFGMYYGLSYFHFTGTVLDITIQSDYVALADGPYAIYVYYTTQDPTSLLGMRPDILLDFCEINVGATTTTMATSTIQTTALLTITSNTLSTVETSIESTTMTTLLASPTSTTRTDSATDTHVNTTESNGTTVEPDDDDDDIPAAVPIAMTSIVYILCVGIIAFLCAIVCRYAYRHNQVSWSRSRYRYERMQKAPTPVYKY